MTHSPPPPGTTSGDPPSPTLLLDRYQIIATLGTGGFGTVVRAFDPLIKRSVAIKTLNPGLAVQYPDAFTNLRERFVREAEAGARMGVHPHIIAVYDLVVAPDGTLYLIQEYAAGGTLAERITGGALPVAAALRLTGEAAQGLRAAHEAGIVHRDVKPANLFLSERGQVKVGDFGIAQLDDLSARSRLGAGHHPGTPLYMAPEQAHETTYVRAGADQYSLGLVLFELLTGTAYKRLTPEAAAERVGDMPSGVGELIGRMTAVQEEGRYHSLGEVAGEIEALLPGIAPEAMLRLPAPPSPIPPVRRETSPDQAVPLVPPPRPTTPAVVLQPVSPVPPPAIRPGSPVRDATKETPVRHPFVRPSPPPTGILPRTPVSRRMVVLGIGGLVLAGGGGSLILASRRVNDWRGQPPPVLPTLTTTPGVANTLVPPAVQASGLTRAPVTVTNSPPTPTSSPLPASLTPAPPAPTLTPTVAVTPLRTLTGHEQWVTSVVFSPDGQTLASGSQDKTARLWRVSDGTEIRTLTGHTQFVNSVAFAPDGQALASGSSDKTVRLWSVGDGTLLRSLTGQTDVVTNVAFAPDGKTLAAGHGNTRAPGAEENTVQLWRVNDGMLLATLVHPQLVEGVAFSPDGQTLASGSRANTITLWRVSDGTQIRTLTGHTQFVNSVAFAPDGQTLISGSDDRTVKLWRVSDGSVLHTLMGHTDTVNSVACAPGGQILASGSVDKTVRLWRMSDGKLLQTVIHTDIIFSVVFAPNGQMLALGSWDKTARLFQLH